MWAELPVDLSVASLCSDRLVIKAHQPMEESLEKARPTTQGETQATGKQSHHWKSLFAECLVSSESTRNLFQPDKNDKVVWEMNNWRKQDYSWAPEICWNKQLSYLEVNIVEIIQKTNRQELECEDNWQHKPNEFYFLLIEVLKNKGRNYQIIK
jgi:hypothetical protein